MLKDKLNLISILLKVLFSVFITCLILIKGDAGSLGHYIGSLLLGGNLVVGIATFANVTLLYILAMYNLAINNISIKGLKQFLLILDISLFVINLGIGTYFATFYNQMHLEDAIFKYAILSTGAAIVCYAISLFVMLVLSKFHNNLQNNIQETSGVNNNPFTFTNRITRKSYLITKILVLVAFYAVMAIIQILDLSIILTGLTLFIAYGVSLFAASKRLRDVKWSQLFLIIWVIPIIGLIIGIPLLFVPTKHTNN